MVAAEQAWAMPKRQGIMPGQVLEPVKKGVTMDGVLVYMLGEEWKEVKVGCVFDYETLLLSAVAFHPDGEASGMCPIVPDKCFHVKTRCVMNVTDEG